MYQCCWAVQLLWGGWVQIFSQPWLFITPAHGSSWVSKTYNHILCCGLDHNGAIVLFNYVHYLIPLFHTGPESHELTVCLTSWSNLYHLITYIALCAVTLTSWSNYVCCLSKLNYFVSCCDLDLMEQFVSFNYVHCLSWFMLCAVTLTSWSNYIHCLSK